MADELLILLKYFGTLLAHEKPLNVWLSLVPDPQIREHLYAVGLYIAQLMGW